MNDALMIVTTQNGILYADQCQTICQNASIREEVLMIELLAVAASYSISGISKFRVGAVVRGGNLNSSGYANLYLGSNIEYGSLYTSLHAEQSAVSNAWLEGETSISSLAVSAAPCGHCRQFLYEVVGDVDLELCVPPESASKYFKFIENGDSRYAQCNLSTLLPSAFGPMVLGSEHSMIEENLQSFSYIEDGLNTQLSVAMNSALEALNSSYAPYSKNYAGCAIELQSGDIFTGRYAENAAFNPSLSPFSAALSKAVFHKPNFTFSQIKTVTLVETASMVSQKSMTELLLTDCIAAYEIDNREGVNLNYFLLEDRLSTRSSH